MDSTEDNIEQMRGAALGAEGGGGAGGRGGNTNGGKAMMSATCHDGTQASKISDSRADKSDARKFSRCPKPKGEGAPESTPEKACGAESDPSDEADRTQGGNPCQNLGDPNGYNAVQTGISDEHTAMSDKPGKTDRDENPAETQRKRPIVPSGKLTCHRILAITETNATAATKDSEERRRDRQDRAEKAVLEIPTLLASPAQHKSDS